MQEVSTGKFKVRLLAYQPSHNSLKILGNGFQCAICSIVFM